TLHRVVRVLLRVVVGGVAERRVDPALGRAGVAARRMDLRDESDVGPCVERLDRGAHARAAGTDDQDVVLGLHERGSYRKRLTPCAGRSPAGRASRRAPAASSRGRRPLSPRARRAAWYWRPTGPTRQDSSSGGASSPSSPSIRPMIRLTPALISAIEKSIATTSSRYTIGSASMPLFWQRPQVVPFGLDARSRRGDLLSGGLGELLEVVAEHARQLPGLP